MSFPMQAQWMQVGDSANSNINVMKEYNGTLYFGGNMTRFNGQQTYGSMTYNGTTFGYHSTLIGGNGFSCLEEYNGNLYGGGGMAQSGLSGTVLWGGGSWQAGPIATNNVVNVNAMLAWNDQLIIGGGFTTPAPFIMQYNGTTSSVMGAGFDAGVLALATYDGDLYAAGSFTLSGSTVLDKIAKWNGSAWVNVGGGMNNNCSELVAYNGQLYASGSFTMAGSVSTSRIARWNGTTWSAVAGGITTALGGYVSTLQVTSAGLLVGGKGMNAGTVTDANVLLFNGTSWSAVPGIPTNETVLDIEEYQGLVYAVGYRGGLGPAGHVYKNSAVGFEELDAFPALLIYPNPTNDLLQLQGVPAGQVRYEVLDATGRMCMVGSLNNTVDVSALLPGAYQIRITTSQASTIRGFVRAR
ncbi:MAG: T9SS type A sorting domain-containing protein [Flavobacteriales bacterium]|nr:T9SS type A sorting domain-containing protein [Flavobacteriales bacterium]